MSSKLMTLDYYIMIDKFNFVINNKQQQIIIMDKLFLALAGVVFGLLLIIVLGLLFAWPVLLLWNGCLVGAVAGITPLTSIWQAWGILILCGLLFKSSSSK